MVNKTEQGIIGVLVLLALVGGGLYFVKAVQGAATASAGAPCSNCDSTV